VQHGAVRRGRKEGQREGRREREKKEGEGRKTAKESEIDVCNMKILVKVLKI
jgi:hypothetical protein